MKRIIIIGPSGVGKTTLAARLSHKLDIEHTELDSLFHQANWQPLENEAFVAKVNAITDKSEWILCGNYYSRIGQEIWPKADTIVWCNLPFAIVFGRLLRRSMRRSLTQTELWNGNRENWKIFAKDSVMAWMIGSWNKLDKRYSALYAKPDDLAHVNLVRLRSKREVSTWLKGASKNGERK